MCLRIVLSRRKKLTRKPNVFRFVCEFNFFFWEISFLPQTYWHQLSYVWRNKKKTNECFLCFETMNIDWMNKKRNRQTMRHYIEINYFPECDEIFCQTSNSTRFRRNAWFKWKKLWFHNASSQSSYLLFLCSIIRMFISCQDQKSSFRVIVTDFFLISFFFLFVISVLREQLILVIIETIGALTAQHFFGWKMMVFINFMEFVNAHGRLETIWWMLLWKGTVKVCKQ